MNGGDDRIYNAFSSIITTNDTKERKIRSETTTKKN